MSLLVGLSKIKEGINSQNFELVIQGYELITGEKITNVVKVPEKPKKGRPKKTATTAPAMINTTQILLGKDRKPNGFVDTGELYQEDKIIDAKLHVKPPVSRREPPQIVKCTCAECGKVYEVVSSLYIADARKLCNTCSKR